MIGEWLDQTILEVFSNLYDSMITTEICLRFLTSLQKAAKRGIIILKEFQVPQNKFSDKPSFYFQFMVSIYRRDGCVALNFKHTTQHKDSLPKESFDITHNSALRQVNMISKYPMNYKNEEENIGMKSVGKFMILCINNLPAHQVMC